MRLRIIVTDLSLAASFTNGWRLSNTARWERVAFTVSSLGLKTLLFEGAYRLSRLRPNIVFHKHVNIRRHFYQISRLFDLSQCKLEHCHEHTKTKTITGWQGSDSKLTKVCLPTAEVPLSEALHPHLFQWSSSVASAVVLTSWAVQLSNK